MKRIMRGVRVRLLRPLRAMATGEIIVNQGTVGTVVAIYPKEPQIIAVRLADTTEHVIYRDKLEVL